LSRLHAFRTAGRYKLDFLTFFQGFETTALNFFEVGEQIFATISRRDEAETFGFVEPFYGTSSAHFDALAFATFEKYSAKRVIIATPLPL